MRAASLPPGGLQLETVLALQELDGEVLAEELAHLGVGLWGRDRVRVGVRARARAKVRVRVRG